MVRNILKNGKEVDLAGYTVSREENPLVYDLIESINNGNCTNDQADVNDKEVKE